MIRLEDSRKYYTEASKQASDIVRQLGLAGIAVIWIFKQETQGRQTIPHELLLPGVLLVMGLGFDLLQYIAKTLAWGIFNRWHEIYKTSETQGIDAPRWINWPTNLFFAVKLIAITAAYVYLFRFLIHQII